ncbi:isopentenyl pyrophosphate isomerase [marine gamma proteobacterium HTCC2207]|jgi:isopentenyl-diphosphate Delta-isomerase|uniref:Isopentenyl-diphosphate delta-isomerase n=1 Tax=gamma proteobacterium HTCC2207 TaxID=314287 RepID=Q1YU67_9GAMM|nr:isopentenyl pyrophosphate isomerase [marine gamma proteobacterium HTCC2207] [gamma proteobacterium HTCC2207]MBT5105310.1 type 2 isopentenyl-diphosphate Delta-isomerase [Porticoccaceae bacterium]MBT6115641.1 type 2 isopentenyl-diphosphate Delta-isomerase [Porticoccaceae bacterium]MBT6594131.1 type 2 isopentenyl-diphosphate Delta-isomerase [Porticoccaceae bacterium]MDB4426867.1 type 2 isopentenyl-diphosphate Delta-isomerase [Porticoccaceae bacterium]
MTEISQRKADHINLALQAEHQGALSAGFDRIQFEHNALPELLVSEVDCSAIFLNQYCSAPLIIGAMTGGCEHGESINRHLAEAAEQAQIPMAVGSQRAALQDGLAQDVRRWAPKAILLGNLGGTQLQQHGVELAQRAVDSIEANAMIIHLNPLQELVQPDGDRDWRGVLAAIEECCATLSVPVIIKEVGSGIGPSSAQRLIDVGVSWIEIAGRGGTSWASIESARIQQTREQQIAAPFIDWGMDTAQLIPQVRSQSSQLGLIASGGLRDGLDIARSLRLGANMSAMAQPFLQPALESTDAVIEKIEIFREQLRWAMFLTGSANLKRLQSAPLLSI